MSFIAFLVLGLIAGALAKLIIPGPQPGGLVATLLLGVVGALIGGALASLIFDVGLSRFWSLQTWIVAILGAMLVLVVYGLVTRRTAA